MSYSNFEEFYPFYLSQHSNRDNRRLHLIGTIIGMLILVFSLFVGSFKNIIYVPLVSYGFAWVGHFVLEKNKPATFKYPLWSLRGDFRMAYEMLTGRRKI